MKSARTQSFPGPNAGKYWSEKNSKYSGRGSDTTVWVVIILVTYPSYSKTEK